MKNSIFFKINILPKEISEDSSNYLLARLTLTNPLGLEQLLEKIFTSWKYFSTGWQELRGSMGGTRRKVWTRTKILSPNIRYFVAN